MNANLSALRALRALPENRYGLAARKLNIAYGLARGIPISRIESERSDPHLFPNIKSLVETAASYHRPAAEGETAEDHAAKVLAFKNNAEAELTAWKRQLHLTWLKTQVEQRQKNVAKAMTPRAHQALQGVP